MNEQARTITITLPDDIDRDRPQDVAITALEDHLRAARLLIGHAERVEAAVRNSAMQDYLDRPEGRDPDVTTNDPNTHADDSRELSLIVRANGALATAEALARECLELLEGRPS